MKMKILLVSPYFKEGLKGLPLGLAYVAGALIKQNHKVKVLDLTAQSEICKKNYKTILKKVLLEFNPDLVGITSTSPTHESAIKTARYIKKIKDVPIVKGGPHETICAEVTLEHNPEIDYSITGEREEAILELVDAILNHKPLDRIKGLVYRENGIVKSNERRHLIKDLDKLPLPARHLLYINKYFDKYYSYGIFKGKKSTSIITSRGCPYNCSFCASRVIWKIFRQRSVDDVIAELKELYSQGFRGFMIEDDISLLDKKWFLKFAKKIKKYNIAYALQTRVDLIDDDIARALYESGCVYAYFGVESGVQDILDKCNKRITTEQAKNAFLLLKKYGIKTMASLQFGLLGEDLKKLSTIKKTINFVNEELKPDEVAISYTSLYPGSPLSIQNGITPQVYEKHIKTRIENKLFKKIAHGTHAIHPKGLSSKKIMQIEKLLKRELKIPRFEEIYKR